MLNNKEFGKRVGLLRKNKNYTQEKMSVFLNVTPQAISKWEQGYTLPDTGILPLLAEVLGTSIDYLLTGDSLTEKKSPYDDQYKKEEYYWGTEPSLLAEQIVTLMADQSKRSLLDIGSGEGRDAVYFAENSFQVDALEISQPGIEKIKKYSEANKCNINILHANMIGYELQKEYDVIYSSGSLQFLPLAQRRAHFDKYKNHTAAGGMNAHLVFVDKPFIKVAPDWEENEFFYLSGDLAGFYADWQILYYDEQIIDCNSAGIPHQHAVCCIIAKNSVVS